MTTPVSRPPENALQGALVARLRGAPALAAVLAPVKGLTPATPAVVDEVREGQAYPYVVVGEHVSSPANDLRAFGRDVSETIHVWTRAQGFSTGQTIANLIVGLLDHRVAELSALLAPGGFRCVSIRHEYAQALRDPDPALRHHVLRFRIEVAQLS